MKSHKSLSCQISLGDSILVLNNILEVGFLLKLLTLLYYNLHSLANSSIFNRLQVFFYLPIYQTSVKKTFENDFSTFVLLVIFGCVYHLPDYCQSSPSNLEKIHTNFLC